MDASTAVRRLLLGILLSAVALTGCSPPPKGAGPAGHPPLQSSLGGDEDDGIGGTGIIGPISGFGSLIVNGLRIHYPSNMATIHLNGRPASTAALKIGRMVEILALPHRDGLMAHRIEVRDAVIGPVEAIDRTEQRLRILGQTIYLEPETILPSGQGLQTTLERLQPGTPLRISGLPLADGTLVATRMEPAAAGSHWLVSGRVKALTADHFTIGGLRIQRDAQWPDTLQNGRFVLVRGRESGGRFLGKQLQIRPDAPFGSGVKRLVIQGYPRPAARSGAWRIGSLQIDMPAQEQAMLHQRIQLTARIRDGGRLHAERVIPLRPAPAAAAKRLLPPARPAAPVILKWDRTPEPSVPGPAPTDRLIQPLPPPITPRKPLKPRPRPETRPAPAAIGPAPGPLAVPPLTPQRKRAVTP